MHSYTFELKQLKPLILPSLCIYALFVILVPHSGFTYDDYCWRTWAVQLHTNGLASAYDENSPINYLPLYVYELKLYATICSSLDVINSNLRYIKLVTWAFDTLSILLICGMVKSESKQYKYLLYGLLNIGFFYNTIIWGQVDSIYTFFVFTSFLAIYHHKLILSILLYCLALNFKLQAIIFLPIVGILWLPHLTFKKILTSFFAFVSLQILILLPFLLNGNLKNVVKVVFGSVDFYHNISINAFNFWYLILDEKLMDTNNDTIFFIFSYKQYGLLLFGSTIIVVLLPIVKQLWLKFHVSTFSRLNLKQLLITFTIIGYAFFYFNTQMHERYIHSVILFLTALAFLYGNWGIWLMVSINYALTLENIIRRLDLKNYETLIFNPMFHTIIYTFGFVWCFIIWFKTITKKV